MVMFFIEWRTKQVHKTHLQNSMYKSMKLTKHTSTGFQVHAKAEPPDRGSTRHAAGCPQAHTAAGHGARHAGGMRPTAGFSFSGCKVSSRHPAHGTRQGAGMSPHSSTAMPTACVWQRDPAVLRAAKEQRCCLGRWACGAVSRTLWARGDRGGLRFSCSGMETSAAPSGLTPGRVGCEAGCGGRTAQPAGRALQNTALHRAHRLQHKAETASLKSYTGRAQNFAFCHHFQNLFANITFFILLI